MLHYERKLPALKVFEIFSSKLCKKGGVLKKIHKIIGKNYFLIAL